ncbi:hypothetical protein PTTG_00827 [Puccinia triticina 1-1 BBBD Race 1]|uniref:Uncharacterized protein n=2 Tax=Puccinia triticina TaxID=208348 RepID=A0A0C4EJA9_PUCT1|nr:uncharacterized protein PtA15_3A579 [Puccinia triticina]OAV93507.1 hypothetical protein PTTG_00827 [Puccinia triticina 1-1 BBBD Race 1]WAQ83210.1 hypothetical protein PtA15_3A579 [Puccinia triticina]WAR54057.1 hypothetical protein PtB15_3B567 [Puccinia triticina]
MSSPSKSALSYRRVALAITLSLATIIFHTILCVLLSYSILDLISPHSRINAGKHTNPTNNSTVAVSNMTGPITASNTTVPVVSTISNSNYSTPSSLTLENSRTNAPSSSPETETAPSDSNTSP